ncbi:hypothetical protein [Bacillus velezensis]|uniref:hypothetical protein n=1 Tax=Bacillus velezensis TaxID=492670 RepID=UPI00202347F0|nr:hypothetical protein [Bacillus velezensis]
MKFAISIWVFPYFGVCFVFIQKQKRQLMMSCLYHNIAWRRPTPTGATGSQPTVAFQNAVDQVVIPLDGTPTSVLTATITAVATQLVKIDTTIQLNITLNPLTPDFSLVLSLDFERNGIIISTETLELNLFYSAGQSIIIPHTFVDQVPASGITVYNAVLTVGNTNNVTQVDITNRALNATSFPLP